MQNKSNGGQVINHIEFKLILVIIFLLFSISDVDAHPGGTDSNGGHRCLTNCSSWGLSYGEYHYSSNSGYHDTSGENGVGSIFPYVVVGGIGLIIGASTRKKKKE